jgi:hypothetical protein
MSRKNDNRKSKYKDTAHFTYHNENPYDQITGDCVIRAISNACKLRYCDVVMDLAQLQCETGFQANCKEAWTKYIKNRGWQENKEPRKPNRTRYTVSEYLDLNPNLTAIAIVGSHHVVAIINGVVQDIWNSSYEYLHRFYTLEV